MNRNCTSNVRLVTCVILLSVFTCTSCLAQIGFVSRTGISSTQVLEREPIEIEQPEPLELEQPETPEVPEFEPAEEPCPCNIRCCSHSLELRRPLSFPDFNMPTLSSFSCCGCVDCPETYFIPSVSQPDTLPLLPSFVISPTR